MASIAESFRSVCGSDRGPPECNTQDCPGATPHVGQGTDDICSGVNSFFFILRLSDKTPRQSVPYGTVSHIPARSLCRGRLRLALRNEGAAPRLTHVRRQSFKPRASSLLWVSVGYRDSSSLALVFAGFLAPLCGLLRKRLVAFARCILQPGAVFNFQAPARVADQPCLLQNTRRHGYARAARSQHVRQK